MKMFSNQTSKVAIPLDISHDMVNGGLSALRADFNIYLISQSKKWDFLYLLN
jgi:hypothetical protein